MPRSIIRLVDNSTIQLRELLAQRLLSAQSADIHVAYLLSSGVKLLEPELRHFLGRGHRLRVLAGGDFGLTEPEALHWLQGWGAQVRLCRDRDGGFGGGASLKVISDEKRKGQAGALFNFILRNRDASGALLNEDLVALFITPDGVIDEALGRQLIWAESDEDWQRYIGEPTIADVVRRLDMLYAQALAHAQALYTS